MKSHFLKENDVVLSSRWQFEDGRSKGMGTEWDQEVVGKVERAEVARLRWRISGRWAGRCRAAQVASIRQMSGQVSRGSAGEYQAMSGLVSRGSAGEITDSMDLSLYMLQELVMDREAWHAKGLGVKKNQMQLSYWTDLI